MPRCQVGDDPNNFEGMQFFCSFALKHHHPRTEGALHIKPKVEAHVQICSTHHCTSGIEPGAYE